MTRDDFFAALSKRMKTTKEQAEKSFDHCIKALQELLMNGDELTIPGFGKFMTSKRQARTARHLQTGQALPVPPRVLPVFKPGGTLKMRVNNAFRDHDKQ
jgi:nucleoid DNA-binding protein